MNILVSVSAGKTYTDLHRPTQTNINLHKATEPTQTSTDLHKPTQNNTNQDFVWNNPRDLFNPNY